MHEVKFNKCNWLFSCCFVEVARTGKVPMILHKCEEFANQQLFEGRSSVKKNANHVYFQWTEATFFEMFACSCSVMRRAQ